MKKFVLAFLATFALGTSAQAGLILHVQDLVTTQSASARTLDIEVWLEETAGTQALVSSYNVGLRISPTGVITFSGQSASVDHPSLFLGQTPTDRTGTVSGYVAGNDRLLTDDFLISGNSADAPVQNGVRDGLFRLSLNVPANAVGTFNVTVDEAQLEVADSQAVANVLTIDNGSIVINQIPEPAFMTVAVLALPLLGRRRR